MALYLQLDSRTQTSTENLIELLPAVASDSARGGWENGPKITEASKQREY